MTQINRSQLEKQAREYIARVQQLRGGMDNTSPDTVEKAVKEVVRASERFVRARGDVVVAA